MFKLHFSILVSFEKHLEGQVEFRSAPVFSQTSIYNSYISILARMNMTHKPHKRTREGLYFTSQQTIGYAFNSCLIHNGTYALMFSLNKLNLSIQSSSLFGKDPKCVRKLN